ncbi:TPA: hypothetical protein ACPVXI_004654 [Vibrio parahaemolyticus]
MNKKVIILAALIVAPFANAYETTTPDSTKQIVSLRYSDTSIAGDNHALWGGSFSTVNGMGNFGVTLSADFQSFKENGDYISGVGQEKETYDFYNYMVGATYGVSDNFYVMPKVGLTHSKYKNYHSETVCVSSACKDVIKDDLDDEYRMSYGIDFMFLYKSIAYGLGVTDYSYFGNRETRANLTIGYKF